MRRNWMSKGSGAAAHAVAGRGSPLLKRRLRHAASFAHSKGGDDRAGSWSRPKRLCPAGGARLSRASGRFPGNATERSPSTRVRQTNGCASHPQVDAAVRFLPPCRPTRRRTDREVLGHTDVLGHRFQPFNQPRTHPGHRARARPRVSRRRVIRSGQRSPDAAFPPESQATPLNCG